MDKDRTNLIKNKISGKRLCWFGTRGIDAIPLFKYCDFINVFCQTAPINDLSNCYELNLESINNERVDLNTYDIDYDDEYGTKRFLREILLGEKNEMILIPYRPQEILTPIYFPHSDIIRYFGLFPLFQRIFEHKPWVEIQMKKININCIPWKYIRNIERSLLRNEIRKNELTVVRASYSSGGAGYYFFKGEENFMENPITQTEDGFFATAPFYENAIPLNLNACTYKNGDTHIFLPSCQLIGIKEATSRPFGYCGNDFGIVKLLGEKIINKIEKIAAEIGKWLHSYNYLGIWGIDLMVKDDEVIFTEINPRFQGSTYLSAFLSERSDDADPYGEHIAAFSGFDAPKTSSLWNRVKNIENFSQLVCYNRSDKSLFVNISKDSEQNLNLMGVPKNYVNVKPEAMIFKRIYNQSVTKDGYSLLPELRNEIISLLKEYPLSNSIEF